MKKNLRPLLLAAVAAALAVGGYFLARVSPTALLGALVLLCIAALVWAARRDRQDPVFRSADERRRQDRERKEEVERAARQRL